MVGPEDDDHALGGLHQEAERGLAPLLDQGESLLLGPLQPGGIFGLVGLLDDGQVEVQQRVERPDRGPQAVRIAPPGLLHRPDQARPQPRQRGVGVDLFEADLDVPPADPPAASHVRFVVPAGEQLADPPQQRALEAVDLGLAARDDLAGLGVTLDLGVEVVDEGGQVRVQQRSDALDPPRILVRPAHVGLQLAVPLVEAIRVHSRSSGPLAATKKPTPRLEAVAWALSTPVGRPFASDPATENQSTRSAGRMGTPIPESDRRALGDGRIRNP